MNAPRIKDELEAILLKTQEIERRIAATLGEEVDESAVDDPHKSSRSAGEDNLEIG